MPNKPSILFIAAWWPTKEDPGSGIFIREHALALADKWNVHVVYLSIEKSEGLQFPKTRVVHEEDEGLSVHRIQVNTPIRRFGIHDTLVKRAYNQSISELVDQHAPIGYVTNVRSHLTKYVPELSSLKGLPFVHIEHFSYYHRIFPTLESTEQERERREISQWFENSNCKKTLVVSNDLKSTLSKEFGVDPKQIVRINNVVPNAFDFIQKEHFDDRIQIMCVGIWEEPKRLDLLIEALDKLADGTPSLVIRIFGRGSQLDDIRKNASSNKTHEVVIEGFKSKDEIARAMQRADFLIHPTDAENAPTVISEALCCGLPVLSMHVNGIPEMIDDSNGFLIVPSDAEVLKEGILRMIQKLDGYDKAVIAEHARRHYSKAAVSTMLNEQLTEAFING